MGIVLDLVLLAIGALIFFICWKNGFVKSVIGLVCDVVAVVAAYALTPVMSSYLCDMFFLEKISSGLDATVRSAATAADGKVDVGSFASTVPESLAGTLEKYNVSDEALSSYIRNDLPEKGEDAVRAVSDYIARPTAQILSNAISFIVIFVVALIILRLVSLLILVIFKVPLIKKADRTAGAVLGAVNAVLVIWVLSIAIAVAVGALGRYVPDLFEGAVDRSLILSFFSKHDLIAVIRNLLERANIRQ